MRSLSYLIMKLGKMGHPRLANKILSAITRGSTADLKASELNAFNVVRHDLFKSYKKVVPQGRIRGPHDVDLRRELFYSPAGGTGGGGALSRGYFSSGKNVPMIDIDLPSGAWHSARQIGFKSRAEALRNLNEFLNTSSGKKTAFKVYDTPGGIRMFDVSRKSRGSGPRDYKKKSKELGGDDDYIDISMKKGRYDARLMPKPGREGDYIAKPLLGDYRKVIKGADSDISRKSYDEITNIHDAFVMRILRNKLKTDNITLGGMLDYVKLLEKTF